jgi:outer membrane protein assembly factor BamB
MHKAHGLRSAIFAVLALLITTGAFAQDWPQWRGVNRDGKIDGFTAPQPWPKELARKWQVKVGMGDATPALVGDKLYVFSLQNAEEVLRCLNAADGTELWRDQYAVKPVTGPSATQHPGPRSSPAVGEGKVVTLGVAGTLSCLDATTGKLVWRKDDYPGIVPRFFTSMSPIIVDGLVIAHLGGEGNGALIAYALATGEQQWKWDVEGPAYASPVVMTTAGVKQIVTLTEKSVVGISLDAGKLLWQIPFTPQGMAYNAATPIVNGDTVIYTGQKRGTHAVKIQKQANGFTANELWSNADMSVEFNSPVLADGLLFGLSEKGNLFCLDAGTGKTDWMDATRYAGNFAAILDAGTLLFALPNNSELIAYQYSDKAYQEIARIKVAGTPTYAYPVIDGKRLFIKDQDSVTLWLFE